MVFDNDDDFGIDIFRYDVWNSVASKNKVTVGLIKKSEDKSEDLQGDFLGTQKNNYQEEVHDIDININSFAPQALKLKKQGYDDRGELVYSCVCKYDVDVLGDDLIVFFDDYTYGLKAGQVFKVDMKDAGMYQGQYCWKEFDIMLIREDGWEYKGEKLTNDITDLTDAVDLLTESDYTTESWAILDTAYNLPFRTNPEGFKKKDDLTSGIAGLVFAGASALADAKTAAGLLVEGEYTVITWAVLVAALALPETTNDEVVAKTTAINNAIAGLELK